MRFILTIKPTKREYMVSKSSGTSNDQIELLKCQNTIKCRQVPVYFWVRALLNYMATAANNIIFGISKQHLKTQCQEYNHRLINTKCIANKCATFRELERVIPLQQYSRSQNSISWETNRPVFSIPKRVHWMSGY